MSEPKYQVGEKCVTQTKNWPELNGIEVTILSMSYGSMRDPRSDNISIQWRYYCDIVPLGAKCWGESALRKKHDPYGTFPR